MMLADVAALVERAQGRVEREVLCTTLDGREIPVLRFGDPQASRHILIQAGIHGREYITSRLAVDLLNDLVDSCGDGIDDVMFHVVPMANPDGAVISLQGPEALNDPALAEGVRQMLAAEGASHTMWKANARGTDLNRNFPEEWEELTGRTPGSDRYRGLSGPLRLRRHHQLPFLRQHHLLGGRVHERTGGAQPRAGGAVCRKDRLRAGRQRGRDRRARRLQGLGAGNARHSQHHRGDRRGGLLRQRRRIRGHPHKPPGHLAATGGLGRTKRVT